MKRSLLPAPVLPLFFSVAAILYFLVLSQTSTRRYRELESTITQLEQELSSLRMTNEFLSRQLQRAADPGYQSASLAAHNYAARDELLVDIVLPEIHAEHPPEGSGLPVGAVIAASCCIAAAIAFLSYRIINRHQRPTGSRAIIDPKA